MADKEILAARPRSNTPDTAMTAELVRSLFDYDPTEPLALRWKVRPWRTRVVIGSIAGYWHRARAGSESMIRYINVGFRDRVPVHHVVWLHQTGATHPRQLLWRNSDTSDCRMENLVLCSPGKDGMTDVEWRAFVNRRNLLRDYGITPEYYARMHAEQNGLCAICQMPETMVRHGKVEGLSVDHCHTKGHVRALLCSNCNNGLGRFGDDPAVLRRAADYLDGHLSDLHP